MTPSASKNTVDSALALYGATHVHGFDRTQPEASARYFQHCIRSGDTAGALRCFDVNAVYVTEAGKFVQGHDAVRQALEAVAGLKPDLQAQRSAVLVTTYDIASWVDEWTLKATLPNGEKLDLAGVSSDVLKRQANGVWTYLVDNPYGAAYLENDLGMTARLDGEKDNVKKTRAYYDGINDGSLNTFDDVIAANVIDHATYADGHSASLKALLSGLMGKMKVEIVRVLADGNFVAAQVRKTFAGASTARVEWNVLRFDNGLAVELWSAGQAETAPNASGRTLLDGPVEVGDRTHTAANKARMQTFFTNVIVGGDFSTVGTYYDGANLIQHDPNAGDGVQAITAYSMGLAQAGTPQVFNKAQLVIGEGDMVLVASDLTQGQQARSYWELYRLQNGKIAERWLVADDISPANEWKNAYGKF
jgi:predicted SnoaL-like aldol condensation-catalyzing enzyme